MINIDRVQRRTLMILSAATMLGGLGVGVSLSVGALLLAEVSGRASISGLSAATFNLGAAIAGIPLARIAVRYGRRRALVTGNLVAMVGACIAVYGAYLGQWMVIAGGIAVIGVASAVQLMSRFAATDLALPQNRARDLSLVVWSISIGAIVGPNLIGPGSVLGNAVGLTPLAGAYIIAFAAQALAAVVVWLGLRPDPLIAAQDREVAAQAKEAADRAEADLVASQAGSPGARGQQLNASSAGPQSVTLSRASQAAVIGLIAMSQAVMVVLMAMTPLQLVGTGGSNEFVGVTLSLHIAGMYLLSPVFGLLATKLGRLPVIYIGWVILIVSAVMAYLWPNDHTLVLVSLTLLGLGWSAVTVAGATLITEITPERSRTKRQGLTDAVMSGSGAAAGAVSGLLFAVGGFTFIAVISVFIIAIGVLLTIIVSNRRKQALQRVASTSASEPVTLAR